MTITKESAEFFRQMCIGSFMSGVDNEGDAIEVFFSPNIEKFIDCHGADGDKNFTKFLRQIADKLDEDKS